MQNHMIRRFLLILYCVVFLVGVVQVNAETLTVGSSDAQPGDTIILPITVDIPDNIAAAVFTLTYDTDYLTLTDIQSSFFDTFINQWISMVPQPSPLPPGNVIVDSAVYNQPLLSNSITAATLIAAVKVQANDSTSTVFTLQFTVHGDAPDGIYPVSISPTRLNNTMYGYASGGETVPILIGALEVETDLTQAYPILNTVVINGTISVNSSITDIDGDGIDDDWELDYVLSLDTLEANRDNDRDGYTDLQEYLNWLVGLDPLGNPYNPIVKNAPGGIGYTNPGTKVLPAIYLLLMMGE